MVQIKSYTDIEQSKKLAEILPLDTADMSWKYQKDKWVGEPDYREWPEFEKATDRRDIPCWSLAALLELLPYEICDDDGESNFLSIDKEDDKYHLVYSDPQGYFDSIESDRFDNCVDACYEMIMKLNEENLL